ncbi:MAG: glycosyl hydrolase [Acidobacteriaceae bacterium]
MTNPSVMQVRQQFLTPPDDSRIMMRWWWFGAAVTKPELEREIKAMKAAGIGGFEILPVYPLALDDAASGIQNLPYLSSGFLDALHFAASEGRAEGMRVDLTLTSGWPYGGAYLPVSLAAGMLRVVREPISDGDDSIPIPSLSEGEKLLAVFQVDGDGNDFHASQPQPLPLEIENGRLEIGHGPHKQETALFFLSSRTGQMVKRPAVGATGFVLDPYDRAAIEDHLHTVGDPQLAAFGKHPPYAVFSDSLEVYGADWTPDFLQQFRQKRGYDLTPYLPALVGDMGPVTRAVRHDWGQTLTELAEENYLTPIHTWAAQHGTRFRSQNYGTPPVILSSNALVDLAEGENYHWREFSETRWASSANHLYGRPVTSAETWTWLHSPAFRGTPLDLKVEADLDFLNGINQLIGHGWPYSPPSAGDPGWSFYAAGAWDDHNPWWFVMPPVTRYLQRVSYVLRQGSPVNDVAVLLPTDDAWANFTPDNESVSDQMHTLLGPNLIPQILDTGFNFDFIDAAAIAKVGVPYRVLILPGITRIPLSTYRAIQSYAQHGGIVIATRALPSIAPGWLNASTQTTEIQQLSKQMFEESDAPGHFIADELQLSPILAHTVQPDVVMTPQTHDVGFVHRKLATGDLYFLVNTSNQTRNFSATFRVLARTAQWWNLDSGAVTGAATRDSLNISMQPYESRILVFLSDNVNSVRESPTLVPLPQPMDLSANWKVEFLQQNRTTNYSTLYSWTDDSPTRFYSGQVAYGKTFRIPKSLRDPGTIVHLDFGPGETVTSPAHSGSELRALLESPVREAAQVYVNGKLAGSIWHPPYEVDVTRFLQPGENHLRIIVGNLAINEMAGRALPDYRLLNQRYGERFTPQDMNHLEPLPSGILRHVYLSGYRELVSSK